MLENTLCLKKVHPFYFCDISVKWWPILIIFGSNATEKIFNRMTHKLSYNIQFVYEYYRIEKQKSANVVVRSRSLWSTATPSSCQFQLFHKFVQSPLYAAFIWNSTISFLCSITFKNIQILSKFDLRRWNARLHGSVVCYRATRVRCLSK